MERESRLSSTRQQLAEILKQNTFNGQPSSSDILQLARMFRKKLKPQQYERILNLYLSNVKQRSQNTGRLSENKSCIPKSKQTPSRDSKLLFSLKSQEKLKDKKIIVVQKKYKVRRLGTSSSSQDSQQDQINLKPFRSTCSYLSKQGHLITENQDAIIVDSNIWVVCDGHGRNGKAVSQFVSKVLHESFSYLFSSLNIIDTKDYEKLSKNIREIFQQSNYELKRQPYDVTLSGSTASVLVMKDNLIVSANCGDSQTILCRNGSAIELTKIHHPSCAIQRKRIEEYGGLVKRSKLSIRGSLGPFRVYNKDGMVPGLAVSRSFGDTIAAECGVICLPEVTFFNRTPQDEFIVMGSDGLFQFFTPQQVIQFSRKYLRQNKNPSQIAHKLVQEASIRWKTVQHDDISCVFVCL